MRKHKKLNNDIINSCIEQKIKDFETEIDDKYNIISYYDTFTLSSMLKDLKIGLI